MTLTLVMNTAFSTKISIKKPHVKKPLILLAPGPGLNTVSVLHKEHGPYAPGAERFLPPRSSLSTLSRKGSSFETFEKIGLCF